MIQYLAEDRKLCLGLPKGRFLRHSERLASALGMEFGSKLSCTSIIFPIQGFLLKASDIPSLIINGDLDCGIAPDEWIDEYHCSSLIDVDIARVGRVSWADTSLCFFGLEGSAWPPPAGSRIATSFPALTQHLGLSAWNSRLQILSLRGSIEAAVPLLAPYGFDLVETGATLHSNSLTVLQVALSDLRLSFLGRQDLMGLLEQIYLDYILPTDGLRIDRQP